MVFLYVLESSFDHYTTLGEKQFIAMRCVHVASKLHNPAFRRSVLCDSYYLENSSRPQLVDEGQPFLCFIKSDRLKGLTGRLQEKVCLVNGTALITH